MNTALPFHNLEPRKYIPRRYSPLFITVVEDDVESLFQYCGLTFTDFFAALAAQENPPIRVMNSSSVQQETQDSFFNRVSNDTTMFSQSFIFAEYEEKDTTVPQLAPVPGRFPSEFHYPSPLSMRPPWYTGMIENLLQSMQFSDFNFCDLPACIIYATLSGTNLPLKKVDEVRKSIPFPNWMLEFVTDIPIIRIVVYDGLLVSKPPSDVNAPRGAFAQVIGLCFRSRRMNTAGAIDPVDLRNLFRYDEHLSQNPQFCGFLSNTDLERCRAVVKNVYQTSMAYIEQSLKTYQLQIENAKKLNNRVKGWFNNKAPDRVTQHLQVPWRKILYVIVGSFQMLMGRYELAKKNLLHFNTSIHDGRFPELRIFSSFQAAMASVMLPDGMKSFKEILDDVIINIQQARSIRFLLMAPLLGIEFNDFESTNSLFRANEAIRLCEVGIRKISALWTGNMPKKSLFLAFFFERYAGLLRKNRVSLLQTARAAILYKQADQTAHSLRCYIWLFRSLPRNSWVLLYQEVWLEKAVALCQLSQWSRALNACKDLLALPDLDKRLHERVISQFWTPFNDSTLDKKNLHIQINSLLEVKSLTMTDKTHPSYWGLPEAEFDTMIKEFDQYVRQKISRTTSVSFDSWYDEEDENLHYNKSKAIRTVGVGTQLILTIELYNRYKFSVHLDRAILNATYEGKAKEEKNFEMEEVRGKDIPGFTRETTKLSFKFLPLSEGQYTVNSFTKNYWGYVDTVVDCGPLVFNAVKDVPMLKMEIDDFPEESLTSQCYEFYINVTNIGNTVVDTFLIIYDHPNSIVSSEYRTTSLGSVNFLTVHHELMPMQSTTIELNLWIEHPGETVYHFCIASNGLRCAFDKKSIKASPISKVDSVILRKSNDSGNLTFQCSITSLIDNLSIVGVIDDQSRYLKLIGIPDDNPVLNKGESISIVGFTKDFDPSSETAEAWRTKLMGDRPLAILYEIEGNSFYAQETLKLGTIQLPKRIKIEIPPEVTIESEDGFEKVNCKISWLDPPDDDSFLYVQPGPINFIDDQEGKASRESSIHGSFASSNSNNSLKTGQGIYSSKNGSILPSSASNLVTRIEIPSKNIVNGCRWFGAVRKRLSKENDFQADITFIAQQDGVYKFPVVYTSSSPDFSFSTPIHYTQTVHIISK